MVSRIFLTVILVFSLLAPSVFSQSLTSVVQQATKPLGLTEAAKDTALVRQWTTLLQVHPRIGYLNMLRKAYQEHTIPVEEKAQVMYTLTQRIIRDLSDAYRWGKHNQSLLQTLPDSLQAFWHPPLARFVAQVKQLLKHENQLSSLYLNALDGSPLPEDSVDALMQRHKIHQPNVYHYLQVAVYDPGKLGPYIESKNYAQLIPELEEAVRVNHHNLKQALNKTPETFTAYIQYAIRYWYLMPENTVFVQRYSTVAVEDVPVSFNFLKTKHADKPSSAFHQVVQSAFTSMIPNAPIPVENFTQQVTPLAIIHPRLLYLHMQFLRTRYLTDISPEEQALVIFWILNEEKHHLTRARKWATHLLTFLQEQQDAYINRKIIPRQEAFLQKIDRYLKQTESRLNMTLASIDDMVLDTDSLTNLAHRHLQWDENLDNYLIASYYAGGTLGAYETQKQYLAIVQAQEAQIFNFYQEMASDARYDWEPILTFSQRFWYLLPMDDAELLFPGRVITHHTQNKSQTQLFKKLLSSDRFVSLNIGYFPYHLQFSVNVPHNELLSEVDIPTRPYLIGIQFKFSGFKWNQRITFLNNAGVYFNYHTFQTKYNINTESTQPYDTANYNPDDDYYIIYTSYEILDAQLLDAKNLLAMINIGLVQFKLTKNISLHLTTGLFHQRLSYKYKYIYRKILKEQLILKNPDGTLQKFKPIYRNLRYEPGELNISESELSYLVAIQLNLWKYFNVGYWYVNNQGVIHLSLQL